MLVLARHVGQRIRLKLGDVTVWVTVVDRDRASGVRLGFDAPPGVVIQREEIIPEKPVPIRHNHSAGSWACPVCED